MRSWARRLLPVLLSLGLVALATLSPMGTRPPSPFRWSLWYGDLALTDLILNLALFLPVGASLAAAGWRASRLVAAALAVSVAVEWIQLQLPGREPSLRDLLCNAGGALLGSLLWIRAGSWSRPSARRAALATAAIVLCFAASGALLAPVGGRFPYAGHYTPGFGHLDRYLGRVHHARIGDHPLPQNRIREGEAISRALGAREPLLLDLEVGIPRPGLAAILAVTDAYQRELLLVVASGDDLVVRDRNRAKAIRLNRPGMRARGALRGYLPGERVLIEITRTPDEACVRIETREICGLYPSVGDAYGFLAWPVRWPGWLTDLGGPLWLLGWAFPVGAWAPRRRTAGACAAVLVAAAAAVPALGAWGPTSALELAALPAGVALGFGLRYLVGWLRRADPGRTAERRNP